MNVQPGNLARIVRIPGMTCPELIDRIVEVIGRVDSGFETVAPDGTKLYCIDSRPAWLVRSKSPLPVRLMDGPRAGTLLWIAERPILDCALRPIGGVPLTDDIPEETPCAA